MRSISSLTVLNISVLRKRMVEDHRYAQAYRIHFQHLRRIFQRVNEDMMLVSTFDADVDDGKQLTTILNRLEHSFMYVKLLKHMFIKSGLNNVTVS